MNDAFRRLAVALSCVASALACGGALAQAPAAAPTGTARPVAAPAPTPPDTLAQRLAASAVCHGKQGEGAGGRTYYPRISGKPARYLYLQLAAFRDGQRRSAQMTYLTRHMSDAYLEEIAAYYASLAPPYAPPASPRATKGELNRGQALVTRGDPARSIPACSACHGRALNGMLPAAPGLVGLGFDYVAAQLNAWKAGTRNARAPDCMHDISRRMPAADIAAVAKWIAAQPATPGTHPEPRASAPLPLACGSLDDAPSAASSTPVVAQETPDAVRRGAYLARIGGCAACHTTRGGMPYAGGRPIATPFGVVHAPNITPDRETGIGAWSADDFWNALHSGRAPDGTSYYPAFPYTSYTRVTRADADAIFAYLRSLPPARQVNKPHDLRFPYSQRALLAGWRALYFHPGVHENAAGQSPEWNRGAYLVQGLGHCEACHTGRNMLGAPKAGASLRGGVMAVQGWYAPSLASGSESTLLAGSVDDIAALVHGGVSSHGAVYGPMADVVFDSLQHLTAADARAIALYLASLGEGDAPAEPSSNRIGGEQLRRLLDVGARVYERRCADCHGRDGAGLPPAYPALAGNRSIVLDVPANPVRLVLFGGFAPTTHANPRPYGMPPFAQALTNEEIAGVVTYIRQSWGNRGAAVTAAQVDTYRSVPLE